MTRAELDDARFHMGRARGAWGRWRIGSNLRAVTWENADVLKIPGSATLRDRDGWSVFVIDQGRAHRRTIQIGHRNQTEAEILGGVTVGQEVVLHPSNQLWEGDRIRTQ